MILTNYRIKSIHGHNEFEKISCPCFDVKEEYKQLNEILKKKGDIKKASLLTLRCCFNILKF